MRMDEPGEQAAIEQSERCAMIAPLPQFQGSAANLIRQALGTNVHLLNMRGRSRCACDGSALNSAEHAYEEQAEQTEDHDEASPQHESARASEPLEQAPEPLHRLTRLGFLVIAQPLERAHRGLGRKVRIGPDLLQRVEYL